MNDPIFNIKLSIRYLILCIVLGACSNEKQESQSSLGFEWEELPDIPQAVGGPIAGISNNALVVAGGAYFTASMFEGGTKVWVDDIYVLETGDKQWRTGYKLPRPLAYSATVNTAEGIICIGGHDSEKVYANVFRMHWNSKEKRIEIDSLPSLPKPLTSGAAAINGDIIYVAGGQQSLDAQKALKNFWALDLSQKEGQRKWKELEPWPGPERVQPVVAAQSDEIYVFSGTEIIEAPEGKIPRRCLSDGYRYNPALQNPTNHWDKVANLDAPVVAGPVISYSQSHILVFSGTDCKLDDQFWELKDNNPGPPATIRAYHTEEDTWTNVGEMPDGNGIVTSKAVKWQGGIVIVSGEDRPAHRSPKVWMACVRKVSN